ncbi:substrate-binding periplasmic protein [Kineococcus xinjiangensis]|uniref:substrate-binding periplasmic protein n=1 Tax=Kineococcus xinjiangensis TaxID=512762 RepID=UPI000CEC712E|nr:transporter substrate-binding domain-containing protein [Kineococcus xinjiangensis]
MRATRRAGAALALAAALAVLVPACGAVQSAPPATAVDPALHERLPPDVLERGVVRVATDASHRPLSSFDADGRRVVGFAPDLLAELGRLMGVRFELVVVPPRQVLAGLPERMGEGDSGGTGIPRFDVALTTAGAPAAAGLHADVVPFLATPTSLLVQRHTIVGVTDLDDLCGFVVAVERDTAQVDVLREAALDCGEQGIRVEEFPSNADALLQLRTRQADALVTDHAQAAHLMTNPRTRSHYRVMDTAPELPVVFGVAVPPSDFRFRDLLTDALAELDERGTYDRLLRRWHLSEAVLADEG